MDTLDITPLTGRSVNDAMLESINPAGIFMYADIGRVAVMVDVIFYFGFRMFNFGFEKN